MDVPGEGMTVSSSMLAPLRNPTFRSLWLATQISGLGWLIQTVAVSWLMATLSSSYVMVALVQASSSLPVLILSIFAGAVADNFDHRSIMFVGRSLIAGSFATMTLLIAIGTVSKWTILGLSFVAGCGIALNTPAWQASVCDIVERSHIPAAVVLISAGFNTIRSVGPALGGVIVASFGPSIALMIATLTNLAPLWTLWRQPWESRSSPFPRERLATAVYDGLRFTIMSTDLKAAIIRGTLLGMAGIAVLALLPVVVRDQIGGGAVSYGVLMGGFGAGALFIGVSNSMLRRILTQERLIMIACLALAACSVCLAFTSSLTVAAFALALGGAGWVAAWSELGVCVQLASPRWVVGRSLSVYYALTYGGIAGGSWLWGAIAGHYSLSWALAGSGGALMLVIMAGLLLPIDGRQEVDLDPLESFSAPELASEMIPTTGPIVVRTKYRIPEAKAEPFLRLMVERRRSKSRAGARCWNLLRDLQDSSQWTET